MSDQDQPTDPLEAARDRLTDRVLAEAVNGESPPDLTDAILERIGADQSSPLPSGANAMRTRRAWVALLTTAASLAIGVVLWRGQSPVGQEIARNEEVGASAMRRSPPSLAEGQATREPFITETDSFGDPTSEVTPEVAVVYPDAEGWRRMTASRAKYKAVDIAASASPQAMSRSESQHVALGPEGQKSERRIGASSLFKTNPTQGSAPKIQYPGSEATERRLAERQSQGTAQSGQSDEPVEEAGRSLPSPYYLSDDVEYFATEQSKTLAAAPESTDSELSRVAPGDEVRRQRQILRRRGGKQAGAAQIYAGTKVQLQQVDDGLSPEYPKRQHSNLLNREGRRWPSQTESPSTDRYAAIQENAFTTPTGTDALSTFSVDVDTASYTNVRQYLTSGRLPPVAAVRVEELINYFEYGYAGPAAESEDPFAASMEVQACPWASTHQLVRIGIKGREVAVDKRPLSNLVFLIDVSGSMNQPNKLPLVVAGLTALTDRLGENDRVAIVVYAGSEGVVLPSTSGENRDEIRCALGRLQAGGSTAGGAGLKLAYEIAERNQIAGGVNRVILCTDGDFNVGLSGTEELTKLVETRAKETGVFLTVLGFGRGNLNDAMLESISGRGDGHYAYLDSEREARRVLSRDLSGTLVTIAKDVKLQVEFNPAKVASYRLIGYENRVLAAKDFNDDTKDAGEIGAGHTVTALYEVVPVGAEPKSPPVDGLKYQEMASGAEGNEPEASAPGVNPKPTAPSTELLTLKVRYKQPTGGASKKLEFPLEAVELGVDSNSSSRRVSDDFSWAAAVAEFGLLLRNSQHAGEASFDGVLQRARSALGEDPRGERAELLDLVRRAKQLRGE